ncbi:uncharacterized protein LOC100901108 [Galendromus occidentalis]|uniref:Uncharacterized protein LOC100901108 n=1 Tax=Galendromus occidentalis TaxID=34638 RepID=A0AAJ6VWE0_9ACAR|nr:uncharacterized protein LOC100901108 [Galendromus occidentalis]
MVHFGMRFLVLLVVAVFCRVETKPIDPECQKQLDCKDLVCHLQKRCIEEKDREHIIEISATNLEAARLSRFQKLLATLSKDFITRQNNAKTTTEGGTTNVVEASTEGQTDTRRPISLGRIEIIAYQGRSPVTYDVPQLDELTQELRKGIVNEFRDVSIDVRSASVREGENRRRTVRILFVVGISVALVILSLISVLTVRRYRRRHAFAYMGANLEAHEMFSSAEILESENPGMRRKAWSLKRQANDISSAPHTPGTFRMKEDVRM